VSLTLDDSGVDAGHVTAGVFSGLVVYTGNVFERGTHNKRGAYGPVTNFDKSATGNVWSNNTWDTGGSVPPAM
jgi:hypothetical protein